MLKMNPDIADIFINELTDSGPEARCKKILRNYRKAPSDYGANLVLEYVRGLPENRLTELRQAARL